LRCHFWARLKMESLLWSWCGLKEQALPGHSWSCRILTST
jgi:hypothetical protein